MEYLISKLDVLKKEYPNRNNYTNKEYYEKIGVNNFIEYYDLIIQLLNVGLLKDVTFEMSFNDGLNNSYPKKEYSSQELNQMVYSKYLSTEHWKQLREKVLQRDNNKCTKCGKTNKLHIHHLTYKRRGYEKMEDLITLCNECHKKEHNI